MINKIKELRAILPVPMGEAKELLQSNNNDVETCVLLYMAKAAKMICDETGVSKEIADKHYKEEKFDINRAISAIKEELYDASYQPIEGVNIATLQLIKDWIYILETNDFAYSLSYNKLHNAISTMALIPELQNTATLLAKVKSEYDIIFAGYSDNSPIEEFVRRNQKLDNSDIFCDANNLIPLQIISIKKIITRHLRNIIKRENSL